MSLTLKARNAARLFLAVLATALSCACFADPVVLRLSTWEGDEALKVQRSAIASFEAAHPGVKVKLEINDYGLYFQKLLAEYAAHIAPDVSMMGFQTFQAFAKRGAMIPLDSFCQDTPGFSLKDYYPQIVQAHRYQGRLYVLPRDIAPYGFIFYNRKIFREEGLPYPDWHWTWDFQERPELGMNDFIYAIHRLTKVDPSGKVLRYGFAPADPSWAGDAMAFSLGAPVVDNKENPTKILVDCPDRIHAYDYINQLSFDKKWVPTPEEMTSVMQSDARQLFEQGKVAMFQGGAWEIPNIRRGLVPGNPQFFDWDVTLFPAYKDGRRAFGTGGSGYCIMSSTQHPKEAWELVQWMAGPQGLQGLAASGLAQPAIRKMALSPPWIPGPNTPEAMRYPPSRILTDVAVKYVVFDPTSEYWPSLNAIIGNRVASIWSREMTASQALHLGAKEAQAELDRLNKVESLPRFPWAIGLGLGCLVLGGLAAWVWWPQKGARAGPLRRQMNVSAYKFLAPWIIGLVAFTAGPMILSAIMSFLDWDMILPARFRGFGNYAEAFTTDPAFYVSLKVTLLYTFTSVPLGLITSLGLALLLNAPVRGIPFFRTCFYIPTVGSAVASALIWRRLFQPESGLINSIIYGFNGHGNFLGLASLLKPFVPPGHTQVDWLGSERTALWALVLMSLWGFGNVLILLAGLQGIPNHYYEAATLDGASSTRKFRHVTLPLLSPAIFFSLVTGVIGSFQTFTSVFVLTSGGPGDATKFYMLNLYNQAFHSLRMGYASALSWILFFIILGFTLIQFRGSRWVYSEAG